MTENRQKDSFEHDLSIEDILASQKSVTQDEKIQNNTNSRLSTKAERYILIGFFILGFGVLGLGMTQFSQGRMISWESVFGIKPGDTLPEQEKILSGDAFKESLKDRTLDTDGDTISDYEEINIYKTSPYLSDSDSDGIPDNTEIAQGTSPICPKGEDCGGGIIVSSDGTDSAANTNFGNILPGGDDPLQAGTSLDTGLLQGTLSPTQLRTLLEQNGAPAEALNTLDDETLVQLYQQVLAENPGITQISPPGTVPAPGENELQALKDLSPGEIRELMLDNGADPNVVNQLTDEELVNLYNDTLDELLQSSGNN